MSNKTYIGIARDHSGSMVNVAHVAMADYNILVDTIKGQSANGMNIGVFVEEFGNGVSPHYRCSTKNAHPDSLQKLDSYRAENKTPLFDATMQLFDEMGKVSDRAAEGVAFLVMIVTDGQDTGGFYRGPDVARKIKELQATDRWTITFRVPRGDKSALVRLGIPEDNILEFNATDAIEYAKSTAATTSALNSYATARLAGATSVKNFYTPDTTKLTSAVVQQNLTDVTTRIKEFFKVLPGEGGMAVQKFCLDKMGRFALGKVYYQLTKREELSETANIVVKHGPFYYTGKDARRLLGLPETGRIKIGPGAGHHEIYVQSRSTNRKLVEGTTVLFMDDK